MPFFHDGVFHLVYLLDENHHQGLGGLGGHQWAHMTTTDLRNWQQHPLAIPISEDFEGSICTGSVFVHNNKFYGFYATRRRDYTQHLSLAVSDDGIHFIKIAPNPLVVPASGYSPMDFRDPFVFQDETGRFHLLVTSRLTDFALPEHGGCLAHLSSDNLFDWQIEEPFLIPGGDAGYRSVPECPDYFHWNGWYYLLFGLGLQTHYRMSRNPFGPWFRPANDTLDNRLNAVIKTAPFGENRRIGAGWIGTRQDNRDTAGTQWGGNLILRELIQNEDGTLGTAFLSEVLPVGIHPLPNLFQRITTGASVVDEGILLEGEYSQEVAFQANLPNNYRLRCKVEVDSNAFSFGLGLRGTGTFSDFYPLTIYPARGIVQLAEEKIYCVDGVTGSVTLEVIVSDDIFDVCIGNKRCMINRLPEKKGDRLFFFAQNAHVRFTQINLMALPENSP